ncbi:hypothetical protein FJ973_29665 [Mesorhizobium sp. B2-1-3]|uniref:phage adaptor protein n=1 Tax=Mesorhizobium sp. B2-1-3 TaxID=2589972 RepID=UPI00112B216F|nr:hypothetical protein [Mesorhizobium sp. B2-1-3]TPN03813.1 hypothetical protein FJ973_29665 [Mesorhizobium sp. B2-1-3]
MALDNYDDLLASITDWMARSDLSGEAGDFIALGEARLNRELTPVELDTTLTGVVDSRVIDIAALSMAAPVALFLSDGIIPAEMELTQKADGTFPYQTISMRPRYWAIDGTNIDFNCPLDQAYSFRFRFQQRFKLSETAPTNWLLTNHPDVYLAASLVWGGLFIQASPYAAQFQAVLNSGIPEVRHYIAQQNRAIATVDPALLRVGRIVRGNYPWSWALS